MTHPTIYVSWMSKQAQSEFLFEVTELGVGRYVWVSTSQLYRRVDPVLSRMEVYCALAIDTTVKCVYVTVALLLRD